MSLEQKINSLKLEEETDLNNNYTVKVFEKLKTQISTSEANEYKNICELFDGFLEKRFLYSYHEDKFSDIHAFLTGIKGWIVKFEKFPKQVLGLVKHVFQIVIDIEKSVNDNKHKDDKLKDDKHLKSWLVLITLMSLKKIPNLIIEGAWEDVFYALLEYTRPWHIDNVFTVRSLTSQTLQTLREVFCRKSSLSWIETAYSPKLCPSPYLRLEILQLLLMFDPDGVKHLYGLKFMSAYCECMSIIDLEKLFSIMGNNLLSVRWLMVCNYKRYHQTIKTNFGSKVVETLHLNKMGKEVRFFSNSLKILGMFAQIAKTKYDHDVPFVIRCISLCLDMITYSHEAFFSENIYSTKLFLPSTCYVLANITDGILTLSTLMNDKDSGPGKTSKRRAKYLVLYDHIVKQRNNIFQDLRIPKNISLHVKLYQREISSHKLSNILLVKEAGLLLPELELGTVCNDKIAPLTDHLLEELMMYDTDSEDADSEEDDDDEDESPTNYYTDSDNESVSIYFDGGRVPFNGFFQEYLN